jgi:hypothetical protein
MNKKELATFVRAKLNKRLQKLDRKRRELEIVSKKHKELAADCDRYEEVLRELSETE